MNNGQGAGRRAAACLSARTDRWNGPNEEREKRKDIFIRIILRHRISSGKVAQRLVNTPPHAGRRPRQAGKPTGALPHLSVQEEHPDTHTGVRVAHGLWAGTMWHVSVVNQEKAAEVRPHPRSTVEPIKDSVCWDVNSCRNRLHNSQELVG